MPEKLKILVIDDEEGIRDLLFALLGSCGFETTLASNGEEGIEKIKEGKFDIVISDLMMPKVSGYEILEILKAIHPETRMIIMTGGSTKEAEESKTKGAYSFIVKPFAVDEILALVKEASTK